MFTIHTTLNLVAGYGTGLIEDERDPPIWETLVGVLFSSACPKPGAGAPVRHFHS